MEKRLKDYIRYMQTLAQDDIASYSEEKRKQVASNLLVQIGFFQHERLVHLIVTVVFAMLTMLTLLGCFLVENICMYAMLLLFVVLLVPYIRHYYILENGVQKLYKYYDILEAGTHERS